MVITLNAGNTHGSKSRVGHASIHPRLNAINHNYNTNNYGNHRYNSLWQRIKHVVGGERNSNLRQLWRNISFRHRIRDRNGWRSLQFRSDFKSSKCSSRATRYRSNYNNKCYYYILVCLLAIGGLPAYAEDRNVSNPVAAATGNVTNQAVQFQNNGAPSRQQYGPNISCNGATMTFSPFYMGNDTIPYESEGYIQNNNWGAQLNFMVPLDGSLIEQCKSIAIRQEEKMRLDYELVRINNCATLMQKGFTLRPGTRVGHLCQDVIPIVELQKEMERTSNNPLLSPIYYNDSSYQAYPFRIPQE